MICSKCNHKLPDDSEFCQYCGLKIEKKEDVFNDEEFETPGIVGMLSDEEINTILKIQAKNTIEAMKVNRKEQPDNKDDIDFGLVPEKPIYTLALKSVDGELEYLNKLYTDSGKKIKYNRRGSIFVESIAGMVDVYDIFLQSGEFYKTIYINMYGARTSTGAPKGFSFKKEAAHKEIPKKDVNLGRNINKYLTFTVLNIISLIIAIIGVSAVLFAVNMEDYKRTITEHWNTFYVYCALVVIFGVLIFLQILSLIKKSILPIVYYLPIFILSIVNIIGEESVFAKTYKGRGNVGIIYYKNYEQVDLGNNIWTQCFYVLIAINVLLILITLLFKCIDKWHSSVKYREICYAKINKMNCYYEQGTISKEEFDKIKKNILSKISNKSMNKSTNNLTSAQCQPKRLQNRILFVATIILVIIIVVVSVMYVVRVQGLTKQIEKLEQQIVTKQANIDELEDEIDSLEDEIEKLEYMVFHVDY